MAQTASKKRYGKNGGGCEQLSQDFAVGFRGRIRLAAVQQDHFKALNSSLLQGANGQERMVERPQAIARSHNYAAIEGKDQIRRAVAGAERGEQTAGAFDEEATIAER